MSMKIPKQGPVVAIDGPAGTGKSTATRRLAELLGFIHVDTGALYRAIAHLSIEQLKRQVGEDAWLSSDPDWSRIEDRARELARTVHLEFRRMPRKNPSNRLLADGHDVTEFIRTLEVSMAASRVSALPEVRTALLGLQRRLGCVGKSILEGRDIGTIVFPDADVKFFLTADVDERAKRRLIELEATGGDAPSFAELKRQIVERDHGDSARAVAPLKKAEDALELDTSHMTLDEVVAKMESIVRERLSVPAKGSE
jgi:CMP/dCMP kinase